MLLALVKAKFVFRIHAMIHRNGGVTSNEQKNERKTSDFPYAAGCTKGIISLSQPKRYDEHGSLELNIFLL